MEPAKCLVTTGVLDPDAKGKTGRGTVFWMTIEHNDGTDRYEYGLLELLDGSFDREAIIKPYHEAAEKARKELERLEAEAKKQIREERKASITEDPVITKIIDDVIASSEKSVNEYKSGKEKAINFLVGMVIKQIKEKNISYADGAFGITELLKKKLV